jgi:hypothetical protein
MRLAGDRLTVPTYLANNLYPKKQPVQYLDKDMRKAT